MNKTLLTVDALTQTHTKEVQLAGGIVIIKQMTAEYAIGLRGKQTTDDFTFQLVADMLVEPQMTVEQVKQMNIVDVETIGNAILEFNRIGKVDSDLKNDQTEGLTIS